MNDDMNLLVCGGGKVATELLKRLGDRWQVTVVEKQEGRLGDFSQNYTCVARVIHGDASSPVVLQEAMLQKQHYVLCLTGDDRVNLAAVTFARANGVRNILSLVHDPNVVGRFHAQGARPLLMTEMVARKLFHYLQDPRINVTSFHRGEGEVLELEVGTDFRIPSGSVLPSDEDAGWKSVALFREDRLLFPGPDTRLQEGDRIVIVGKAGVFQSVCTALACDSPQFPRTYGSSITLGLPDWEGADLDDLLAEGKYLGQNTKVEAILALCESGQCHALNDGEKLSKMADLQVRPVEGKFLEDLKKTCREKRSGLAVLPPMETNFLKKIAKASHIALAHALPCPLLIARRRIPYDRILVPFNGKPRSEQALRVAMDFARQIDASVTVALVREADFLHKDEDNDSRWTQKLLVRSRELAHVQKFHVKEELLEGNPVSEIIRICDDFDLMVIGSTSSEKDLFEPHIGELLVQKSPTSVLIVTG